MPKAANALSDIRLKRIVVLHKALLKGKQWADDLVNACKGEGVDVNDRIVKEDLAFMRAWGMPVSIGHRTKPYKYTDPNFSLINFFDGHSASNIKEIQRLIKNMIDGIARSEKTTLMKIQWAIEKNLKDEGSGVNNIIRYQKAENVGYEKLEVFYEYIQKKQVISFEYQRFNDGTIHTITCLPLQLREYLDRWTLIVQYIDGTIQTISEDKIMNFPLDRILNSKVKIETGYKATYEGKIDDRFKNVIGNTKYISEPEIEIQFTLTKTRANYVSTKPIHLSQKETQSTETTKTFKISIIPNPEFYSLMCSFAEDLVWIEPAEIREKIREKLAFGASQLSRSC